MYCRLETFYSNTTSFLIHWRQSILLNMTVSVESRLQDFNYSMCRTLP
jgi:hypothetical protein